MGTKQTRSPAWEHTCDGCGATKTEEGDSSRYMVYMHRQPGDPPWYWRTLSFPRPEGATGIAHHYYVGRENEQYPMVEYLLCWACQEKVQAFVAKLTPRPPTSRARAQEEAGQ